MSLRALCCRLYYASTLVLLELVTFHSYVPLCIFFACSTPCCFIALILLRKCSVVYY